VPSASRVAPRWALRPALPLAGLVAASFVARFLVALGRPTPNLFPDEYTYAQLGRSIASFGRPVVRGQLYHFPALLQPILTAPAWLVGDPSVSYRLIQALGALAMSLAAVPVFLLARRLGLGRGIALGAAALAVLVPDLLYSSFVSSEPLAYPLVLAAVAAATAALVRPTRRAQLAVIGFAALAAFARVQFAVLPLVFAAAVLVVGWRERRLRAALREQRLSLAVLGVAVAAVLATGLGPYAGGAGRLHLAPLAAVRWAGLDAMTLAYASGWILVPGALLGIALGIARPRSREELAFTVTAALLGAALLLEAGVLQAGLPREGLIQERYVFYLVPLAAVGFALYASRGWPSRIAHLVLAAGLVVVSARVPLGGYATPSTVTGSPVLFAVYWLRARIGGEAGIPALLVAGIVAALAVAGVVASRRPRLGTWVALGLAVCATGAASAGAVALDRETTTALRGRFLPNDRSWVDHAGLGRVALLSGFGGEETDTLEQLFWNASIDRVLLLPGATNYDRFRDDAVVVGPDGSLFVHGKAFSGPLLVDGYAATARLRGARLVAAGPTHALWRPEGTPRLELYFLGHYYDGWLSGAGLVEVWPARPDGTVAGWVTATLVAPRAVASAAVEFRAGNLVLASVRLRGGVPRRLRLAVCARGPWSASFRASVTGFVGSRFVSVRSTAPRFVPDPRACAATVSPGAKSA
jgi:hypothetical protein